MDYDTLRMQGQMQMQMPKNERQKKESTVTLDSSDDVPTVTIDTIISEKPDTNIVREFFRHIICASSPEDI